jgi:hypothetical protein
MVAKFRRGAKPWGDMGSMNSIRTAVIAPKPTPPPEAIRPSSVQKPVMSNGRVPQEWTGKWLLLRGEFCAWTGKPDDDNPACGNWDWIFGLEDDSLWITGEFPLIEASKIKMNHERCALDGKTSPQQRRSDDDSAVQYNCKLDGGTISFNTTSILKRDEYILPGVSMEKNDYTLQVRLMEGGRCQFVTLEQRGHTAVNFKGKIEHRSHNFDSGGSLKRNISCKVFSSEPAARRAYKGRAELKFKREPKSSGNRDDELGD